MGVTAEQDVRERSEETLRERYEGVKRRIAEAARRAGRTDDQIILVAVTKHASIDEIRQLIEFGHQDFGENRVQNLIQRGAQIAEFLNRHREMSTGRGDEPALPESVRWHMIGHLQRNKVRKVIDCVRLIHSVDSLRLAEEIQTAAVKFNDPVEVLVQVNIAQEKQKEGVIPAAAAHLVEQIDTMIGLRPRGLMCMAPYSDDPEDSRPVFERCLELFSDIGKHNSCGERFDILSLGMSNDFEVAIECGSNVVRVGSAIFGGHNQEGSDQQDPEKA